jgi:hypothetical protein
LTKYLMLDQITELFHCIRATSPQPVTSTIMASSTSTNPLVSHAISEKLSKNNFLLWKTQVLPIVCGARLEGFLTGASKAHEEFIITTSGDKEEKSVNPAHEAWITLDQQVLGFLLSSQSWEVLQQVTSCKNAAAAWKLIGTPT